MKTQQISSVQMKRVQRLQKDAERIQRELSKLVSETPTKSTHSRALKNSDEFTASGRPRNDMTLKEAILKVTSKREKTLDEILAAVQKLGYKFSGKRPSHSVGAFLYGKHGKKVFKNRNARFSPYKSALK